MKRYYSCALLLLSILFSCKKVDEQLESIDRQPGVYDMSPGNAFKGDTIMVRGRFNKAPDLQFFFGERPGRIVVAMDVQIPRGGLLYGQGGTVPGQAYQVIVPDSISGSLPVT